MAVWVFFCNIAIKMAKLLRLDKKETSFFVSVLRCGEKKSDYLMTYLRNNLYFCRAKVCHNKILGQSQ